MKQRLNSFWFDEQKLGPIWEVFVTGDLDDIHSPAYKAELEKLFMNAIHRQFNDLNASGEDAELWRRFFYDFRKMHHFVYRNDFASVILEVADNPRAHAASLINFLKSGHLPGHERKWQGVIGQSMKSPTFFLARELRRLNIVDQRFDEVAYYMNSPARNAASQLGWIEMKPGKQYTFEELTDFSRSCFEQQTSLRAFYDLPLQWHALNHF